MLRGNNEKVEPQRLAGSGRSASRVHHWRQPGHAARRCSPTSIDSALSRLTASVAATRAYLVWLKQLEQWKNDRLKTIDWCLGRVRRVEKVVAGEEKAPPLPGGCPPHLLLVACYADLARQAVHGPSDKETSQRCNWSSTSGDQSDGDVKTSSMPDCLFGPLHDAAMAAGLAVLAATDQRVPAADLQVEGNEATAASTTIDSLTTEHTSLMSMLPPLKKSGRTFDKVLYFLARPIYRITGARNRRQQASRKSINRAQLRSFADFVAHNQPIVRAYALPPDRRLVLSRADYQHETPSVPMEQIVDEVDADVMRRIETEVYGAKIVLEELTRRLDTAPRSTDSAAELARELDKHTKLLEMSSRYENMEPLMQSLVTCAMERVRNETAAITEKCKCGCPCRSVYHVVVE